MFVGASVRGEPAVVVVEPSVDVVASVVVTAPVVLEISVVVGMADGLPVLGVLVVGSIDVDGVIVLTPDTVVYSAGVVVVTVVIDVVVVTIITKKTVLPIYLIYHTK